MCSIKGGERCAEYDSSNRPSNATKEPVLSMVLKRSVCGITTMIAECFKKVLLKAKNLIETCSEDLRRNLTTDAIVRGACKVSVRMIASCAKVNGVRCVTKRRGLPVLSSRCASEMILRLLIPTSRVTFMRGTVARKAGKETGVGGRGSLCCSIVSNRIGMFAS